MLLKTVWLRGHSSSESRTRRFFEEVVRVGFPGFCFGVFTLHCSKFGFFADFRGFRCFLEVDVGGSGVAHGDEDATSSNSGVSVGAGAGTEVSQSEVVVAGASPYRSNGMNWSSVIRVSS